MKIKVIKDSLLNIEVDTLIVSYFEDEKDMPPVIKAIDAKCGGIIKDMIDSGDFTGKLYELSVHYTAKALPAKRIVMVGLGKRTELDLEKLRGGFSKAAQHVRSLKQKNVATSIDPIPSDVPADKAVEAVTEGILLGLYQFTPYKTLDRDKIKDVESLTIVCEDNKSYEISKAAVKSSQIIAKAVYFVRDIVSRPGNNMTPTDLANEAIKIAKRKNVKVTIINASEMKKMGMNALLGVARGSNEPPKFIILEYYGGRKSDPAGVLVGKGITFDSGGISLKPAAKMDEMKTDMAGGAAVLGTIMAVADLKLPVNVVALVPATENLPGGRALKPGDILKSMSGQTIEVLNTDAEGRLILADALSYAGKFKPAFIIDLATLTGACVVALGNSVAGMMGTDDNLKEDIKKAAFATGEKVWELPIWEDYQDAIKSDIADFKNVGNRDAGAITAAVFLSQFVGDHPWVHLDIAGPAWSEKDRPYSPKGASGIGVRLLVEFLRNRKPAAHK
ncbi:MAG: leucyl aminopeptidase [Deltaproteobacteria bacterium]|nr:leucyl aminopeptidase [Deltaproteobacteria bacterium]